MTLLLLGSLILFDVRIEVVVRYFMCVVIVNMREELTNMTEGPFHGDALLRHTTVEIFFREGHISCFRMGNN